MDPSHEPLPDDAIVAHLRARAPGLPTAQFDARAVTARARHAWRRHRRRNTIVTAAVSGTVAAYLALALAGPVSVPGLGTMSVPGGAAIRSMVSDLTGQPPGPDEWQADVDRLEAEVLPVALELDLSYYHVDDVPCRILWYSRGHYQDPGECAGEAGVPQWSLFDAEAVADFDRLTDAVERSGVAIERIQRDPDRGGLRFWLEDSSWQYNWMYVYMPEVRATQFPGGEWTHIGGDWWFLRAQDD
jgi:hypothetical protein